MVNELVPVGQRWNEERCDLFCYEIDPPKLVVPSEGRLEVTLKPKTLFGNGIQYVCIELTSGILKIENSARKRRGSTQLFGFFRKDEVLKFGICLRDEDEVDYELDKFQILKRKKKGSSGELRVVHGGIINEEETWRMLLGKYEARKLEARADWALEPGVHEIDVFLENGKDEKVKHIKKVYEEKCEELEQLRKGIKSESSKRTETDMEKERQILEKKDWRAENHGLKIIKLADYLDQKPEKKLKNSKESKKSESQNHPPKSSHSSQSSGNTTSKEIGLKTANADQKPLVQQEKKTIEEKKKKKNPCCSIL
ncbi:unnamed protein product [Caenorhabditis brenneri]